MDSIAVARIGIILSTLGGFLVAPELIGIERIERFQSWLADSSRNILPTLIRNHEWAMSDAQSNRFLSRYARFVFWLIIVPTLSIVAVLQHFEILKISWRFPTWSEIIIFCLVGSVFVYLINQEILPFFEGGSGCVSGCISLLLQFPFALLYLVGLPAWYLLTLITLIIATPIKIMDKFLSGKGKLKSFLTKIGIVMIVLGAALQLATTK